MARKELGIGHSGAWRLAAALLVAFVLSALPASVWAASPHVQSTSATSRCQQCHALRDTGATAPQRPVITADNRSGTCVACHDGGDSSASNIVGGVGDAFLLASGHSMVKPSAGTTALTGCDSCHDPHATPGERRMLPAQNVNGVAVSTAGNELCVACHNSANAWFGSDYPSTAAPVRDAAGYPISGTWTGPAAYASSGNAHRRIPETTQTPGASDPVKRQQGDCLYCHAAHRGPNAYDGLVATFTVPTAATLAEDKAQGSYAALCFECHGGTARRGFTTAPTDIKQFATSTVRETGSWAGHRIITSGGTLPVGSPLPCYECHNPHGSKRGNGSLLSDERGASLSTIRPADVRQFCFTCHTTADSTSGWDSAAEAYTTASGAKSVVGILRSRGVLHLPVIDGHNEGDIASCYDCHGNSYAPGEHNVHDPGKGRIAYVITAPLAAVATTATASPITMADMLHALTDEVSPVVVHSDPATPEAASETTPEAASEATPAGASEATPAGAF